jgi:type IV pilus assembly protein PilA
MKPVINQLKRGFTLIELMIVVAIIGLLAALAIPNFIKFQARARQAEARTNLKAVWTAEKSYFGDKQAYLDLFDAVGFAPEFNNRYQYFAGSAGIESRLGFPPPAPVTAASLNCPAGLTGVGIIDMDENKWGAKPAAMAAPAVAGTTPNRNLLPAVVAVGVFSAAPCCPQGLCEFAAGATGNIDNDPTLDEWFISSQGSVLGGAAQACLVGVPAGNTGTFAEGEAVNICNDVTF